MKIKVEISTNLSGSTCTDSFEIEDEVWEEMSEEEKEEMCRDAAFDMVEWTWYVE